MLQQTDTQNGRPAVTQRNRGLKLLDIEPSLAKCKELAQELGYVGVLGGGTEMNIWLHKATMNELVTNGGHVPVSIID